MSVPILIGIDVGGSTVRVAAVDARGAVLAELRARSAEVAGSPEIGPLVELIEGALRSAGVDAPTAIGAGVTGHIGADGGVIDNPFTLSGWHGLALGRALATRWAVPVAVENDVDAAALGEYWRGAGRGQSRLFVLAIGTGIGTAFVLDGELYRGAKGLHPEAGHQVVDPSGPLCFCGAHGCLEVMASGRAIERLAAERMPAGEGGPLEGRGIAAAARAGDATAREIFDEVARHLGTGLINVASMLAPTRILVGGGVGEAWDLLADQLRASLRQTEPLLPRAGIDVLPFALGERAGTAGAAYAAYRRLQGER